MLPPAVLAAMLLFSDPVSRSQVLKVLHDAEMMRVGGSNRSILQVRRASKHLKACVFHSWALTFVWPSMSMGVWCDAAVSPAAGSSRSVQEGAARS